MADQSTMNDDHTVVEDFGLNAKDHGDMPDGTYKWTIGLKYYDDPNSPFAGQIERCAVRAADNYVFTYFEKVWSELIGAEQPLLYPVFADSNKVVNLYYHPALSGSFLRNKNNSAWLDINSPLDYYITTNGNVGLKVKIEVWCDSSGQVLAFGEGGETSKNGVTYAEDFPNPVVGGLRNFVFKRFTGRGFWSHVILAKQFPKEPW